MVISFFQASEQQTLLVNEYLKPFETNKKTWKYYIWKKTKNVTSSLFQTYHDLSILRKYCNNTLKILQFPNIHSCNPLHWNWVLNCISMCVLISPLVPIIVPCRINNPLNPIFLFVCFFTLCICFNGIPYHSLIAYCHTNDELDGGRGKPEIQWNPYLLSQPDNAHFSPFYYNHEKIEKKIQKLIWGKSPCFKIRNSFSFFLFCIINVKFHKSFSKRSCFDFCRLTNNHLPNAVYSARLHLRQYFNILNKMWHTILDVFYLKFILP